MGKKMVNQSVVGLCTLGLVSLSGCVDDAYDLSKDIDMSVTVGGDLTVPASSTDKVLLKDVLEIADNSVVKADADGNYSIVKDGEKSNTDVTVDNVSIDESQLDFKKAESSLEFVYSPQFGEFSDDVDFNETTEFSIRKTDVTTDLTTLNWAEMDMVSTLVFDIKDNSTVKSLWIKKGFRIEYPAYMTVASTDANCKVVDGHILEFVNDMEVHRDVTLKVDARIVKMDFTHPDAEGQGLNNNHELIVEDVVKVSGKSYISSSEFDSSNNTINLTLVSGMEVSSIDLTDVNGVIDPVIDINVDPIEINDLPDFLNDDEVRIDLADPRIYLNVSNDSPVAVDLNAELVPYKNGAAVNNVGISCVIPAEITDYTVCFTRNSKLQDTESIDYVYVENLNDLIERIPDVIKMENVEANAVEESVTVTMGSIYNVTTDYRIDAPLMFNEGTVIVYSDSTDGLSEDLDGIDFKQMNITMDVVNDTPLDLDMEISAVDVNGNVLSDVSAVVKNGIAAGTTTTGLEIELTSKNGAIKNMDGIKFDVVCNGNEATKGISLNENQGVKFDNMKIKLVGGLNLDLND